jgi:hypothetical protein
MQQIILTITKRLTQKPFKLAGTSRHLATRAFYSAMAQKQGDVKGDDVWDKVPLGPPDAILGILRLTTFRNY